MTAVPPAVAGEYRALLEQYIEGKEELALLHAHELGRQAAVNDLGFSEIVHAHHTALGDLIGRPGERTDARDLITRSTALLSEGLAAFQVGDAAGPKASIGATDRCTQLHRVLDHLPALACVKGSGDRVLEVNDLFAEAMGIPVADIVGKNAEEVFGAPDATAATTERRVRETGLSDVSEEVVATAAGSRTFLMARFLLGDPDAALCTIATDITDRTEVERSARLAQQQAEETNTAKNNFLSDMGHELRTPLNSVLGFGQLLQLDELTADQAEATAQIMLAGRHLLQLVEDVLDVARIDSGRLDLDLDLGPVDLLEAVHAAVDLVRPSASLRHITIDSSAVGNLVVRSDERRLAQILLNLLTNAIKYNRDGGSIVITAPPVDTGRIALAVSDTGDGIHKKDLPRVFKPFDRLGAEETSTEGTGIGLSLSLGLARLMGGSLTVTSVRGKGSSFTLELPAAGNRSPEAVVSPPQIRPAPPEAGLTIVCIEDNIGNRTLIEDAVTRLRPGTKVLTAASGRSGIALVQDELPDLVLLDLQVPDLQGEVVLAELKSDGATCDIPVVVVSATAEPRTISRLKRCGASDYLTKPVDLDDLLAVLDATAAHGAGCASGDKGTRRRQQMRSAHQKRRR